MKYVAEENRTVPTQHTQTDAIAHTQPRNSTKPRRFFPFVEIYYPFRSGVTFISNIVITGGYNDLLLLNKYDTNCFVKFIFSAIFITER